MNDLQAYLDSGILETYLLGELPAAEACEVEKMAATHPEVKAELEALEAVFMALAQGNPRPPVPELKAHVMAALDTLAMQKRDLPPVLHAGSTVEDYRPWLEGLPESPPPGAGNIYLYPIVEAPELFVALAWVQTHVLPETHHNLIEKFLILEGTCNIALQGSTKSYGPGDFLSIPLHQSHHVTITSNGPCKFLLQRVAA